MHVFGTNDDSWDSSCGLGSDLGKGVNENGSMDPHHGHFFGYYNKAYSLWLHYWEALLAILSPVSCHYMI